MFVVYLFQRFWHLCRMVLRNRQKMGLAGRLLSLCALLIISLQMINPVAAQSPKVGESSGLPVPRFVSVKSKPTRVRFGPSRNHDIAWTFERAAIPIEIIQEFDNWRRIRDADGDSGWMHSSLLTGQRTVIVSPWVKDPLKTIDAYASASLSGRVQFMLQPNVLAEVQECNGTACLLKGADWRGWVDQNQLWGVYRGERVR